MNQEQDRVTLGRTVASRSRAGHGIAPPPSGCPADAQRHVESRRAREVDGMESCWTPEVLNPWEEAGGANSEIVEGSMLLKKYKKTL